MSTTAGKEVIDGAVSFILNAEALEGGYRDEEERETLRYVVGGTMVYILSQADRHGFGEEARHLLAHLPDSSWVNPNG